MSGDELLCFIFGCIVGFVTVGALILINERMKAGEVRRRNPTLKTN